jgi:hypothetical protein
MPDEFYSVAFREKLYSSLEQLQTNLDIWLEEYNQTHPHSGKYCFGKTPWQTFLDFSSWRRINNSTNSQLRLHRTTLLRAPRAPSLWPNAFVGSSLNYYTSTPGTLQQRRFFHCSTLPSQLGGDRVGIGLRRTSYFDKLLDYVPSLNVSRLRGTPREWIDHCKTGLPIGLGPVTLVLLQHAEDLD